ncbi:MAG: glycogen synthase GlgA [candidate division WOR-3 bacterium]|nr:MAG: glycogen synthase GlgA [candidate division WOR-3 bacterium]
MRVAFVASEAVPHAKTGGLADVVGALPKYLKDLDIEATVIMPRYKDIEGKREKTFDVNVQGSHRVGLLRSEGVIFVDYPPYFDRNGLYGDVSGDYPDNCERFTLFCKTVGKIVESGNYDLVHCHDWQSGMVPLYLKLRKIRAKTIFTIHNLGYQGKFPKTKFPLLGIDDRFFSPEGFEFFGDISFLKAGIVYSDAVTTVSPNYAQEIQTQELGFGLDGVLRMRAGDLHGILNGIDYCEWDPASDDLLYEKYSDFAGKAINKTRLCAECCLDATRPLIGMVSRIAGQKGFDILVCAMDEIIGLGYNMIILGYGEESYHDKLMQLHNVYPNRLSVNIKFDNRLAHRIYAGSDFFLMPSLYEPCGLGQLISLRYGTVPIVRRTGGLADTVVEFDRESMSGNGFLFSAYNGEALVSAVVQALGVFAEKEIFENLSEQCMEYDYSWNRSAREYSKLYGHVLKP